MLAGVTPAREAISRRLSPPSTPSTCRCSRATSMSRSRAEGVGAGATTSSAVVSAPVSGMRATSLLCCFPRHVAGAWLPVTKRKRTYLGCTPGENVLTLQNGPMRIGINGSSLFALGRPITEMVDHVTAAEADGCGTYWVPQLGAPDALTVLGAMGQATSRIELGTAVIATWPRHPTMLAAQALTTSELSNGRLLLGIGLAHKPTIEETLKIPFVRPARHMDEYLSVLLPLLEHRLVSFDGEIWSAHVEGIGGRPDVPAPSVLLAAMGPRMLELAGSRTDGTILWLSGPRTVETVIGPALTKAADAAGRPAPRIVASVPVCVTDQPDAIRSIVATVLVGYNDL